MQKKSPRRSVTLSQSLSDAPLINGEDKRSLISCRTGIIKQLVVLEKSPTEPAIPHIAMATVSADKADEDLYCWGKGVTMEQAKQSAIGEACEIYSATRIFDDEIMYDTFEKMREVAIDPRKLILYHHSQYSQLGYSPFQENKQIAWAKAFSLVHDREVWVPAESVFLSALSETSLFEMTSNGLGAGATISDAVVRGALEVIERDALMVSWYKKLSCLRVDPQKCCDSTVRHIFEVFGRRSVEVQLYRLVTDAPCHVFMCIGIQISGSGPNICIGLGADFLPTYAAAKACLEFGQVRHSLKQRMNLPEVQQRINTLVKNPRAVEEMEDHGLLYCQPHWQNAFDFLMRQPVSDFCWKAEEMAIRDQMLNLKEYVKELDSDLIYYDLTSRDLSDSGWYTCRVLIPGLQPIHFGYNSLRLSGSRLSDFPETSGFDLKSKSLSELDIHPHPLI